MKTRAFLTLQKLGAPLDYQQHACLTRTKLLNSCRVTLVIGYIRLQGRVCMMTIRSLAVEHLLRSRQQ